MRRNSAAFADILPMRPRASEYSFTRYLAAKRTVDDRALNKDVFERLRVEVAGTRGDEALRVVELGAGIGVMLPRLVDWGLLRRATYVLFEMDAGLLDEARRMLSAWAGRQGHDLRADGATLRISGAGLELRVEFYCMTLEHYLAAHADFGEVDVLVVSAFLDLVDLSVVTERLVAGSRAPRLFWLSINFDGETVFEPSHPDDGVLLGAYHRSMDERKRDGQPAGDSRTGRHLFTHLRRANATVLAAGASDWVVLPAANGYPADEEYFLHHLLHTIDSELSQHADVDRDVLANWVELRHAQAERAELACVVHQLDFVGRPASS
jgi:hypothetical protein